MNLVYEPPEDGLVKAETYVGVEDKKWKYSAFRWCVICEQANTSRDLVVYCICKQ
jgi:hypothetical protein